MLKGIALYCSLERVTEDFHLYVMAFDSECYNKLMSCCFDHMTVELLNDFETPELLAVKPTRTKAEYCWTCGPSVIWHFMKKYNLPDLTYLDSDLYFIGDPHIIQQEIGDSSVCITEQGVSEKASNLYGRFCVQYVYFKNDDEGCNTLLWWRKRCIEWCYQRFEEGKFGDQKYLDKFPVLCPSLCILKNPGAGIAPWNMHGLEISNNMVIKNGKTYPLVFYHMHGIVAEEKDILLILRSHHHRFSSEQLKLFLLPYAQLVKEVLNVYFGRHLVSCQVYGMSRINAMDYKIRSYFRGNTIVQWVYYKLLNVTYKGHGTKM